MARNRDQNIIRRLRYRELVDHKSRHSHYHMHRCLYQNVFPNMSVINIDKPPCFLRKFTPDGKYLIAFSNDQSALHIYEYRGPAVANNLLHNLGVKGDYIGDDRSRMEETMTMRANLFSLFFKLKHIVHLTSNNEQLNRECSLFTEDSRYVIVASAAIISDQAYPHYYDVLRNNESIDTTSRGFLEDYWFHMIDMQTGKRCDRLLFRTDRIMLSHNQGIYLYKNVLAVLSIQHQTIHIYHIMGDNIVGKRFLNVNNIGRFCFEDDSFLVSSCLDSSSSSSSSFPNHSTSSTAGAIRENWINSLKHRFLVYLYRKSEKESRETGNPLALARFHQNFEHYCSLRMWKMQLLDQDHLLIKYDTEDIILGRASDLNNPSFYAVYQISEATILAIYENTSNQLLWLFENFCDYFRNTASSTSYQHISSPSNCIHAHLIQQRVKKTIISARYGSSVEATKRILSLLPISAQSYTSSPYLDLSLFSYDDRWVSVMERPKGCGEYPIKFYCRDDGSLRFKIHAEIQGISPPPSALRLVAFAFHPHDPFALSVQRTNSDFVVNLHLRHVSQQL